MPNLDKHILLAKWLEGTLTDEEVKILENEDNLDALKTSLDRLENYDYPPMDEAVILNKIKLKRRSKTVKIRHLIPIWTRIAATIVVVVGLSFWWWTGRGTNVYAGIGEKKELTLPAHSEVVLNAGSELCYFDKKWQTERQMTLKGEAFFKVTKGIPFRVESSNGIVEVLGTEFSIKDRGIFLEVICYEGKVRVSSEELALENILQKGQGIIIEGNTFRNFEDNSAEPQWMKNVSVFSKMPLSEVLSEMERQYGIKFNFLNVDLQRPFSGEFPHDDLEGALERVCGAMSLNYVIKTDDKTIEIRSND